MLEFIIDAFRKAFLYLAIFLGAQITKMINLTMHRTIRIIEKPPAVGHPFSKINHNTTELLKNKDTSDHGKQERKSKMGTIEDSDHEKRRKSHSKDRKKRKSSGKRDKSEKSKSSGRSRDRNINKKHQSKLRSKHSSSEDLVISVDESSKDSSDNYHISDEKSDDNEDSKKKSDRVKPKIINSRYACLQNAIKSILNVSDSIENKQKEREHKSTRMHSKEHKNSHSEKFHKEEYKIPKHSHESRNKHKGSRKKDKKSSDSKGGSPTKIRKGPKIVPSTQSSDDEEEWVEKGTSLSKKRGQVIGDGITIRNRTTPQSVDTPEFQEKRGVRQFVEDDDDSDLREKLNKLRQVKIPPRIPQSSQKANNQVTRKVQVLNTDPSESEEEKEKPSKKPARILKGHNLMGEEILKRAETNAKEVLSTDPSESEEEKGKPSKKPARILKGHTLMDRLMGEEISKRAETNAQERIVFSQSQHDSETSAKNYKPKVPSRSRKSPSVVKKDDSDQDSDSTEGEKTTESYSPKKEKVQLEVSNMNRNSVTSSRRRMSPPGNSIAPSRKKTSPPRNSVVTPRRRRSPSPPRNSVASSKKMASSSPPRSYTPPIMMQNSGNFADRDCAKDQVRVEKAKDQARVEKEILKSSDIANKSVSLFASSVKQPPHVKEDSSQGSSSLIDNSPIEEQKDLREKLKMSDSANRWLRNSSTFSRKRSPSPETQIFSGRSPLSEEWRIRESNEQSIKRRREMTLSKESPKLIDPRMEREKLKCTGRTINHSNLIDLTRRSVSAEINKSSNSSMTSDEYGSVRDYPQDEGDLRKRKLRRSESQLISDGRMEREKRRHSTENYKQRISAYFGNDFSRDFFTWLKHWDEVANFRVIYEIQANLFEQPKSFSLAHCVAEDLRMGRGIAVSFKRHFKNVPELLNQNAKEGGLALLQDQENGRFIYYLVTKKESSGKPTYLTLWKSLCKMRDHIKENNVKKLAIPKLAAGLDRLEWPKVKSMIEWLFKDMDTEIRVCIFEPGGTGVREKISKCQVSVHQDLHVTKISTGTLILYFATVEVTHDEITRDLSKKFNFWPLFQAQYRNSLGDVVYYDDKIQNYGLCGCIVRKNSSEPICFKSLYRCIEKVNRMNRDFDRDSFSCVAFQWLDRSAYFDDLINQKVITLFINYLENVEVHICKGNFDEG